MISSPLSNLPTSFQSTAAMRPGSTRRTSNSHACLLARAPVSALAMVAQLALWTGALSSAEPYTSGSSSSNIVDYYTLHMPEVNDPTLHILSPTQLELVRINSEDPSAQADNWSFVGTNGNYTAPNITNFTVLVDGQ